MSPAASHLLPGRRGAAATVLAVVTSLVVTLLLPTIAAAPAAAREVVVPDASAGFDVVGRGWGHGRGMSQWGAQGMGLRGENAADILDFYYPGSSQGPQAFGPVRVLLSGTGGDVVVRASSALVVTDKATGVAISWAGLGSAARVTRAADGYLRIQYRSGTTWVDARNPQWPGNQVSGPVELTGLPSFWVTLPDGSEREYRGTLTAHRRPSTVDVVNTLDMEEYLYGVVPLESPSFFTPAALQAQAVAARSYAWAPCNGGQSHFDVRDTTACQVYRGRQSVQGTRTTSHETTATTAAVDATRHQVLRRSGTVLRTEFSSSNGGWTVASNGWPAQPDPYDGVDSRNSNHTWTTRVSVAMLQAAWPQVGTLRTVETASRDGNGELGGRVLSLVVTGSAGSVTVTGEEARNKLGLRSSWFAFRGASPTATNGDVVVVGTGSSTRVTSLATRSGQPFVTEAVLSRLGASNLSQWRFFAFGDGTAARPDLVAVRTSGGASGRVEVHTLTGASNYQSFSTHAATPLPALADGGPWVLGVASLAGSGEPDLFAVRTSGGASGKIEVHVLSAASGYTRWVSQKSTAFDPVAPGQLMDFIVGDAAQQGALTAVVYGGKTGSGRTEVHRLTAGSGWKTFDLHAATALHLSATSTFTFGWGDYDRDGTYELYAVKLLGTGTGNVEVHVLDDVGGFTRWIAHRGTTVPAVPGTAAAVRMW